MKRVQQAIVEAYAARIRGKKSSAPASIWRSASCTAPALHLRRETAMPRIDRGRKGYPR